ncbi:tRNA dimethylallyltransferase [hydrothermal vent metagenome]|uniref:tRNA dimethylallyltransferase n=1 Tax=hydrothermal vent metagenome TaxID=652676 RepID=A0A1W1C2J8_9ZZZZ
MEEIKQLALIGSTASGKSSLAIKTAQHMNAHILSLDSLSIYKEIDIVSAKPTIRERDGIVHFGIDVISPNESFDVTTFIALYRDVYQKCQREHKNLIIVGGTSFYLKMLLEGVSTLPTISKETQKKTKAHLFDLQETYQWLYCLDPLYMSNIESSDTYRIEKVLNIYLETGKTATEYFKIYPPKPIISTPLLIYQIEWQRDLLRQRIAQRTKIMLKYGLIDEICMLEKKYTRAPNCMKAIGIKETLAYLDGIYSKEIMTEKITTNTARLAKRQKTFNNSQFKNVIKGSVDMLEKLLLN